MIKEDLKIVFFGTPEFAVESLAALVEGGYNVAAVVTMPDKHAGRGHKLIESPVKQYAVSKGLPVLQPEKLKAPEFVEALQALSADLFIVIAFRMLPEVVWAMPPCGTFNLHASLLPRYRGAAPINRAIMNGDTETGVTTFMLKHEIDTGDILRQERVEILPEENVGDVYDKLMRLGAALTLDTVEHIIKGDLTPMPQEKLIAEREPLPAPKIFAEDCEIHWNEPAVRIHNLVRGLSPYPAARALFKSSADAEGELFKIYKTALTERKTAANPGALEITPDLKMYVATALGEMLEIIELQPSGKKRMSAEAFLRGARLGAEACFE